MEAHITDLATAAGRMLFNPALVAAVAVGSLALLTGTAGRVLEFVEAHSVGRHQRAK